MPESRRGASSAVAPSPDETKIYVSHRIKGGNDTSIEEPGHVHDLPYLDEYDIASDTWTTLSLFI